LARAERWQGSKPVIDPRAGDVEDDASSTQSRSLLALAGSLLSEISLPKLLTAWMLMLVGPSLLLGLSPLIASAWVAKISGRIASPYAGLWPIFLIALLLAIGWFGGRTLFRLLERSFWTLNSLVVEPFYAILREGLQYVIEQLLPERSSSIRRGRWRAASAGAAGVVICALAFAVLVFAWPRSRWVGNISDLISPLQLVPAALLQAPDSSGEWQMQPCRRRATFMIFTPLPSQLAAGAWRTCRICTPSVSATVFASRAAGPGHAATSVSQTCFASSMPFMPRTRSMLSSLPEM
jgi:hypothetical protein